mgnify:CR=1 FL=1
MDSRFTPAQRAYLEDHLLNPLTVVRVSLEVMAQLLPMSGWHFSGREAQRALDTIDELARRVRALDQPKEYDMNKEERYGQPIEKENA